MRGWNRSTYRPSATPAGDVRGGGASWTRTRQKARCRSSLYATALSRMERDSDRLGRTWGHPRSHYRASGRPSQAESRNRAASPPPPRVHNSLIGSGRDARVAPFPLLGGRFSLANGRRRILAGGPGGPRPVEEGTGLPQAPPSHRGHVRKLGTRSRRACPTRRRPIRKGPHTGHAQNPGVLGRCETQTTADPLLSLTQAPRNPWISRMA